MHANVYSTFAPEVVPFPPKCREIWKQPPPRHRWAPITTRHLASPKPLISLQKQGGMRLSRVNFPYNASGANPHGLRHHGAQHKKPSYWKWVSQTLSAGKTLLAALRSSLESEFSRPCCDGVADAMPRSLPISELGMAAAKNPIEMLLSGLGPSVDRAGEGGSFIWVSFCPYLQPCSAKPRLGSAGAWPKRGKKT